MSFLLIDCCRGPSRRLPTEIGDRIPAPPSAPRPPGAPAPASKCLEGAGFAITVTNDGAPLTDDARRPLETGEAPAIARCSPKRRV